MESAMKEVTAENTPIREAARKYVIPYPTLRKHLQKGTSKNILGRYRMTFTAALGKELLSYLKKMQYWFYGLTRSDLSRLALLLTERNGIPNSFTKDGAGEQWIKGFMERHPDLSI